MKLSHAVSMPILNKDCDENSNMSSNVHLARTGSTICLSDLDNDRTYSNQVHRHVGYKKVLVTGGAGFIGSHVAEYLLARGDDVVIVDEMNDYYDVKIKKSNIALLRQLCPDEGRLSIYYGDICIYLSLLYLLLRYF